MSRDYVLHQFKPGVDLRIDYSGELNPQQFAAVTALPGPSLVIAGAGAGKTRTLTYRVAYLIEQGIPPECILLLTFTNKAANEMMRRVANLLANDVGSLWGGTFHSVGNRILRRHTALLGYPNNFTILDREDAKDLISACLGDAGIDVKETLFPKPDALGDIFSLAANTCATIQRTLSIHYKHFERLAPRIEDLRQRYGERKRKTAVMDFDDLLLLWLRLWREHPDVLSHYQRRFQFVLVDEYQDTNQIQCELVDLLAARHHNLMAVGDDSQSIYSWRGANFLNILKFPDRHPNSAVYKIETNYRSTPQILALANAAIAANVNQYVKRLAPVRKPGTKPALVVCPDAAMQSEFVAQRVLELREEGTSLSGMAVLYRSHFHALELQLELTRRNIPFSITSGIRFFEQAHIKDVAAYVKLVCNPADELAFKRIVRMLPGIGPKAAARLWNRFQSAATHPANNTQTAEHRGIPAPQHRRDAAELPPKAAPKTDAASTQPEGIVQGRALAAALQAIAEAVPSKAAVPWASQVATFAQLESPNIRGSASDMIRSVLAAGYEEYLEASYDNYHARSDDLEQLALFAAQFRSPEEFLTQLALLSTIEAEGTAAVGDDEERLRLSTIHQAKGLEFDVVFVIMLCDGLFPPARSVESPEKVEEERRLFYVSITRARNELYLSYPLVRTVGSGTGDFMQRPSRFIKELHGGLFDVWKLNDESMRTDGWV